MTTPTPTPMARPAPTAASVLPAAPVAAFDGPRGWVQGLRYGFMGFPLAFVALPLYVLWPHHMAAQWGVPLAALGALLLAVRLVDAVVDPLVGLWVDGLGAQKVAYQKATLRLSAMVSLLLLVGFVALFFPWAGLVGDVPGLLAWSAVALVLTCLAFSVLTVTHQAWGARLGGTAAQRARVVGWREGLGLAGVVTASVLPTLAGLPALAAALALALVLACWAWAGAVVPDGPAVAHAPVSPAHSASDSVGWAAWRGVLQPLAQPAFRRLLAVYVVNGMASAVPATLVLFFIQDRLQAPAAWQPLFLGSYFISAALAIGPWLRGVARWGLARTWGLGMALSVAVFAGVLTLGAGDLWAFWAVCVLSGAALGADLVLPPALLNGLIADLGHRGRSEGAYLGWWSFATKLNLALAAGLALPLLAWLGYVPGQATPLAATGPSSLADRVAHIDQVVPVAQAAQVAQVGADGLQALSLAYGLVPCVLKLGAGVLLYFFFIRKEPPCTAATC